MLRRPEILLRDNKLIDIVLGFCLNVDIADTDQITGIRVSVFRGEWADAQKGLVKPCECSISLVMFT